jgi:CubicO group peptidase (beta-lactamase class C family)
MARAGWLWRNWGNWNGQQVVPADYLRQATVTAAHIVENTPEEHWRYGHAFWTNDYGKLWPSLPRDSFAAAGAGCHHIWVSPGLDLVVAQRFSPWQDQAENDEIVIPWILDAVRE